MRDWKMLELRQMTSGRNAVCNEVANVWRHLPEVIRCIDSRILLGKRFLSERFF